MEQIDWLDESYSLPCGDDVEDMNEQDVQFLDLYDLNVSRVMLNDFSHIGKRRKRKSKK